MKNLNIDPLPITNLEVSSIVQYGEGREPLYQWMKFADTPTSGMSDLPAGKRYVGLGLNKETPKESTNYYDYEWIKLNSATTITASTQAPSGVPLDGEEWVIYNDEV